MAQLLSADNRAYGAGAARWAASLPATVPLISSDIETVHHAFAEAARRRKLAEPFGASVILDDPRARFALYVGAPPVLAQITDYDQRAGVLDAVNAGSLTVGGRQQREMERYDARLIRTALEFLVTADLVVTRSSVERERLIALTARRFVYTATVAPVDRSVPLKSSRERDARAIVVWAPTLPAEACGMFAFALEEFACPTIIVCAGGQPAAMRAGTQFVSVAEGAAALARAAVIIDASLTDPGTARALARWGVPVATASCAGALDFLDGITVFDPWNHRTIATAASNALGNRAPRDRGLPEGAGELERSLAYAKPPVTTGGPLVSVIVPTMNRRDSLYAAVASINEQTYANVQIVLVNDGGPPIDRALLGVTRELQIVEYAPRRGVAAAVNTGIAASHGTFISLLADDDLFCPDHVDQLVQALLRTGGDFAHAIELCEHFESRDGAFVLFGHSLIAGDPATPTQLLTHNSIGGPSIMFTRTAFDRVGEFDERGGSTMDLEMWMRMSKHFDFIHVDRVTTVMSMRDDSSQLSAVTGAQTADFYRYIYERHPTTRTAIADRRVRHANEVETIPIVRTLPQIRIDR